jgi:hypothetical protein
MPNKKSPTLEQLQTAAVPIIRQWYSNPEERTGHELREVAELLVPAREYFFTKEGRADWTGRSFAYRRWVRETMTLAGVLAEDVQRVTASLRYHSGNVLRERLTPEELESYGLLVETPTERGQASVQRGRNIAAVFTRGGEALSDVDSIVHVAEGAIAALGRVTPDAVRALPAKDRRRVAEAMESVHTMTGAILLAAR